MRARATVAAALTAVAAFGVAGTASGAPPAPLDPQNWSFQDNLTWSDYKKLPGPDYSDATIQPTVKKWKVALILTDYPDRPFTISQPAGSTIFGTPTAAAHSIPREQVPRFYADFLNKPSALNNFQTMNRYWMEDSFGKYGVELVPFGPYKMPLNSYQYHIANFQNVAQDCPVPATPTPPPGTDACNQNYFNAARAAWIADIGATEAATYDNMFWTSAGQDESSSWQEFGEMRFTSPETVTDAFGPKAYSPLHTKNWATTRYVPWTSWAAASNVWPSASGTSSTEAESAGMAVYAHELSHNLSIPDNYNNPFSATPQRTASGMWDMMSRGSFNGPGGQHTRWQIPPTQGGALGAQHNLRNKRFLNFIGDGDILRLNRDGLAQTGMAVAEIKAREVAPGGDLAGVRVLLNGAGDTNPPCRWQTDPTCEGPVVHGGHRHHGRRALQRLHGRGRPADRLGLLRPRPRRPGRQDEDRQLDLRLVQLLRLVHRLQPAGHQPGRLRQGRRHAGEGDDRRRAPDQRRLVQRRHEFGLDLRVQGRRQQPALLHHRQAHRRRRHPALHGRHPLARGLRSADARRQPRRAGRRAPPRATRPARSR